jgi:hypothetical protein
VVCNSAVKVLHVNLDAFQPYFVHLYTMKELGETGTAPPSL